ncbi:MAG: hypothetical protein QXD23_03845 [Candidatus Micrarchaeaceae archaeon]
MISKKNGDLELFITNLSNKNSNKINEFSDLRRKRLELRNKLVEQYENYRDKLGPIQDKLCERLRKLPPTKKTFTYRSSFYSFKFKRHPNGGGWVQEKCKVPIEIKLDKNVIVMGKVRILPKTKIGENSTIGYLGMRKELQIEGIIL